MVNIGKIDSYKEFLKLEDLYRTFISIAGKDQVFEIGKSKNKEKILCGKFGTGKKTALLFGYPHPNEPVGSLTCLSWVKILKQNPDLLKEYTWYIVPCADPDGAKLNEGWFKGKFSIKKYVYEYYRQIDNQTEWSFPVTYKKYAFNKPTPQTRVLMKLIKQIKPSILYSLHNSGFSGSYFFLSKDLGKSFYEAVEKTSKRLGIPIHRGEPEVPFTHIMRPGFFSSFGVKEEYDFLKTIHQDPVKNMVGGTSSGDYAKNFNKNLFSLVCEIPYVYDPILSLNKVSNRKRKDVKQEEIKTQTIVAETLVNVLSIKGLQKKSIFYTVTKQNAAIVKKIVLMNQHLLPTLPDDYCTIAEVFDANVTKIFYGTLMLGELRRLLLDSVQTESIQTKRVEIERLIDERIRFIDKNSKYNVLPISSLVEFQIRCLTNALANLT